MTMKTPIDGRCLGSIAKVRSDGTKYQVAIPIEMSVAPIPLAVGLLGSDLEFRVRELLTPATRPDRPALPLLIVVATAGFAASLLVADPIHTAFESLLRLLAG